MSRQGLENTDKLPQPSHRAYIGRADRSHSITVRYKTPGEQSEQGDHDFRLYVLLAVEFYAFLDCHKQNLAMDQSVHDLDHLPQAASQARQLADQQAIAIRYPSSMVSMNSWNAIATANCSTCLHALESHFPRSRVSTSRSSPSSGLLCHRGPLYLLQGDQEGAPEIANSLVASAELLLRLWG